MYNITNKLNIISAKYNSDMSSTTVLGSLPLGILPDNSSAENTHITFSVIDKPDKATIPIIISVQYLKIFLNINTNLLTTSIDSINSQNSILEKNGFIK